MIALFRAVGVLALAALGACADERHPLDRHLSQLRPVTVATPAGPDWPAGTLLCPLTLYQSELPASGPAAERVNAFLKRKQFAGDEFHWSLVAVKPDSAADDGIEQLLFKRGDYDVVNEPSILEEIAETLPAAFTPQVCVPVERARVLVARARSTHRTLISFGTE
jgi:hypothetical protein